MSGRPVVLAHRGASRRAAENTLEAFRLAPELGADGVELDVRRTSDGVLVVHHDAERDGFGVVVEHPFAALRAHSPDVPTLDEALDVLDTLVVNIEIKCLPWEPDPDPERQVVSTIVESVRARGTVESTIVSSFDLEAVNAVRALDPKIATGWLTYGRTLDEAAEIVGDLGHRCIHPDRAAALDAPPGTIARLTESGLRVNVWTVNEPEEMRRLAGAGVAAIITDVPDVARTALDAMAPPG